METCWLVSPRNLFFTLQNTSSQAYYTISARNVQRKGFFCYLIGEEMGDEDERRRGCSSRNTNSIPMEISLAEASSMFPGFRFSPTDEELIQYYLKKKLEGSCDGVEVIPEVDICRYEPWDLPAQSIIQSDNEWFFFSPRGRKYPNGSQSKRATESGYWKATGKERSVKSGSSVIGTKRTLVFHTGRAPKGQRTEWIMHEYCTSEKSQDAMVVCRLRKNSEFRLNDNPRTNLPTERDLSTVNNSPIALSGGEQSGMADGKVAESCSKEFSSSYNSHSVEQIDGYESDDKATNEFSEHDTSSLNKGCAEEEDFYADIMKDDIIKLDDPSLNENPESSTAKSKQPAETSLTIFPSHGTANRRLRLRREKLISYQPGIEIYKFDKGDSHIGNALDSHSQQRWCLLDTFPILRRKSASISMFLVLLILLILVLFFMGHSWLTSKA
ncbi:hypothetical protein CDL12_24661 [Handroanthus impetiginosus]|uniref:NAC domain-containing protein n=1 Tax=Handroanthus impetiginosus TaxID=429701 RepID=A0A2G9GC16_9LAMI|nr:hypothetical protein CDL12_24661 [Handroanthus impetiginosus]